MATANKVMIVDDSKSMRVTLRDMLSPQYNLAQADSGESALEILPEFKPDLILLDIEMPGIDGYEVCRWIRSNPEFRFVKIIFLSSLSELKNRLQGYKIGADDYLMKPFNEEELLAKARVFLRLKKVEDQLYTLNNQLNKQVKLRTAQLLDAEKMAAIGRHTAGIAHNLNSPLQTIMSIAEIMNRKDPDDRNASTLSMAADQMKQIIATLLTTSRMENHEQEIDIDLNGLIRDQIELLKANPLFRHRVQTELKLEPLPTYRGIYAHFSQSIGNLIKNAVEAMYAVDVKRLFISTCHKDNAITIHISDSGTGIAHEHQDRIFNPFFTTKPLSASEEQPAGTGLGLASSMEMIASYGGNIRVESTSDRGTTFEIKLPLKDQTGPSLIY